eukprot:GEZU01026539.1.p1 GENE.GEZU01026539.1~~GEZU01026539.1.p1  ORF type:complete len:172 (-),score=35.26 GEZU01026539.1:189-629(-)
MVNFCENNTDCRRQLQLEYFGEKFDRAKCDQMCDNCVHAGDVEIQDVTAAAKQIVHLVQDIGPKFSMTYIVDVWRGSKNKNVIKNKHDAVEQHGAGKEYSKDFALAIMRRLVLDNILEETRLDNAYGGSITKVSVGNTRPPLLHTC